MSGVFAYFSPRGDLDAVRQRMAERLHVTARIRTAHARVHPEGGLGFATLGLYAWEAGNPARSADGQVALWFIGELFHHRSRLERLARQEGFAPNDCASFALAIYQAEGVHGLSALSGTFFIAIWDAAAGELVCINDRAGFYPHFLYQRGPTLALAPSLWSVLAAPEVPAIPDDVAIAQFLRFQQHLGRRTWVRDVMLMPPATIMRFRPAAGTLTEYRYWEWNRIQPYERVTTADALDECEHLFERSVAARTDRPRTVLLLSGGLDSRTILAYAPQAPGLPTLTYGAPGSLDVGVAARVAAVAGSPHEWDPYDNGHWVAEGAATYLALTDGAQSIVHAHGLPTLMRVQDRVDAVLTGWGGGTILGGYLDSYRWDAIYRTTRDEETLTRLLYEAFCRRLTWPGLTDDEAAALMDTPSGARLLPLAFDSFREEFLRTSGCHPAVRLDGFYIDEHERRGTLYMHVVARGFVEARAPFKDDALVSYFLSLPERVRRSPGFIRAMLHRRSPKLARIPYERDGRLPHPNQAVRGLHGLFRRAGLAWRQRVRGHSERTRLYADYEEYLRTDLRGWVEHLLFSDRLLARGWFDRAALQSLWSRHLTGDELWTIGKLAPIITVEQVMRRLFEHDSSACGGAGEPHSTACARSPSEIRDARGPFQGV